MCGRETWMKTIFFWLKSTLLCSQFSPRNTGNRFLGLWNSSPRPPLKKGTNDPLLIQSVTLFKRAGYLSYYWNPWLNTCDSFFCTVHKIPHQWFSFFWEMEANTCDVDPPDGSYSNLSCHAIVHKYNWFLKLSEAPNKICTADWLSATSQTDGWCTDNSHHSGSYNTSNWFWCKCLKAADQTMDHRETWTVKSKQYDKKQAERSRFVMNFR